MITILNEDGKTVDKKMKKKKDLCKAFSTYFCKHSF